jgi:hypothetical protein
MPRKHRIFTIVAAAIPLAVVTVVACGSASRAEPDADITGGPYGCIGIRTVTNADGSFTQTWTDPDNGETSITVPWPGFDPTTATNAQLEEFNIPDRPVGDAPALKDWLDEWGHPVAPLSNLCIDGQSGGSQDWTSGNWTGYVSGVAGQHYTDTNGRSRVVHAQQACPHGSSVSAWVGLDDGSHLTQAGWDTPHKTWGQYYFWYEQWPAEIAREFSLAGHPIREGDEIYTHVHLTDGAPSYHFVNTTQNVQSHAIAERRLQANNNTRFVAISERMSWNGVPENYRTYAGAAPIYYVRGNGALLNAQTPRGGSMWPAGRPKLGHVGGIYGHGDFNTYHDGCE